MAVWYPVFPSASSSAIKNFKPAQYNHRISLAKIGTLLANWNLPDFLQKDYKLIPTMNRNLGSIVVNGEEIQIPASNTPMVLLAHRISWK